MHAALRHRYRALLSSTLLMTGMACSASQSLEVTTDAARANDSLPIADMPNPPGPDAPQPDLPLGDAPQFTPDEAIPVDALLAADLSLPGSDVSAAGVEEPGVDTSLPAHDAIDAFVVDTGLPDEDRFDAMAADAPSADLFCREGASEVGCPTVCSGVYDACGCGCCSGAAMTTACYYPSLGDTTANLAAQDSALRSSTNCNLAGCSAGVHYVCCAEAPVEPAGTATYAVSAKAPGDGTLTTTITKSGPECATLRFSAGPNVAANPAYRIASGFALVGGEVGCGEAGANVPIMGAVGTLDVYGTGTMCMSETVSMHATVFTSNGGDAVKSVRFDFDNITAWLLTIPGICGP